MEPTFWQERWQRGEIGFHQPDINFDLQVHWPSLRIPPDRRVFVPLCGRSRDMCWLRSLGHPVTGVELSELAVRAFFTDQGLVPERALCGELECWQGAGYSLYCGDLFALTASELSGCAAVYDRAALVALPATMRHRYAQHLQAALPAEAVTLLLTLDYPQEQMSGPPFSVDETEVRRLFEPRQTVTLLSTRDTLAAEPRLQQRGLRRLSEQAWQISPAAN